MTLVLMNIFNENVIKKLPLMEKIFQDLYFINLEIE